MTRDEARKAVVKALRTLGWHAEIECSHEMAEVAGYVLHLPEQCATLGVWFDKRFCGVVGGPSRWATGYCNTDMERSFLEALRKVLDADPVTPSPLGGVMPGTLAYKGVKVRVVCAGCHPDRKEHVCQGCFSFSGQPTDIPCECPRCHRQEQP